MTTLLKGGIAFLTVGSLSTAGYFGGAYLFGGTKIKDLINEEFDYILLDTKGTNDDSTWDTNWNSYKSANSNSNDNEDIFKLNGWKKGGEPKLVGELKKKCQDLSEQKITNKQDATYSNVTKYCARRVTIKDQLEKDNLVAISESAESSVWEGIAQNRTKLQSHFSNLEINPSSNSQVTADNVKKGCKDSLSKDKSKSSYNKIYLSFKEVCVIKN